ECERVLAAGGRLFATFFLLNDTSRALMADGKAGLTFLDVDERLAILDESLPEEAVAYDDEWVFETLRANGLELIGLHPGSWAGSARTAFASNTRPATRRTTSPTCTRQPARRSRATSPGSGSGTVRCCRRRRRRTSTSSCGSRRWRSSRRGGPSASRSRTSAHT